MICRFESNTKISLVLSTSGSTGSVESLFWLTDEREEQKRDVGLSIGCSCLVIVKFRVTCKKSNLPFTCLMSEKKKRKWFVVFYVRLNLKKIKMPF